MCGIFACFSDNVSVDDCSFRAGKCVHRGPDNTSVKPLNVNGHNVGCLVFHRLAINDLSDVGNQPFSIINHDQEIYLICNGEIYNSKALTEKYNLPVKSSSDCEVIIHLYQKMPIDECVRLLDGYFAFVLVDVKNNRIYSARDRFGIRSLYVGGRESSLYFASEMKCLYDDTDSGTVLSVNQFPPRTIQTYELDSRKLISQTIYYTLPTIYNNDDEETTLSKIRTLFTEAVRKRLQSDRPMGCFLSGGFDSSLVADRLTYLLDQSGSKAKLRTFSTGMDGSTDLHYARVVAKALDSTHYEFIDSRDDMLMDLPNTVYECETFDPTSVRASTPMRRLSYKIRDTTDVVVVFSGEGSDEASGSYLYFHNAPSPNEFQQECLRLLNDIHYFDVLRGDKSTACAGLEIRVPFLDNDFIDYYMSIRPELKMPRNGIEKYLIRKAFTGHCKLPDEILWRTKEAFSDGVSSKGDSWHNMIGKYIGQMTFSHDRSKFMTKEAQYYRHVFDSCFPNRSHVIPYTWLPKWSGNVSDPSARVLKVYNDLSN